MLIGTEVDLRSDSPTNKQSTKCDKQPITCDKQPITFEQGWNLTRELGGVKYLECSALTKVYIYNILLKVFEHIILVKDLTIFHNTERWI